MYIVRYSEVFRLWDLNKCSESMAMKFASKVQAAACISDASETWKGLREWNIEPALPQTPEEIEELEKEFPREYASALEVAEFSKKLRRLKP
jgi:hypothetical protein